MRPWVPFGAIAFALLPLAFVHPLRVSGRSMEPTLEPDAVRFALRAWCAGTPQRGEVWLIDGPEGPAIKRIVGLPGERLEQREGQLFLDGQLLREPYLQHPERGGAGPWTGGSGFLVLGDNRPESRDSRSWGPVPRSAFRSRILAP